MTTISSLVLVLLVISSPGCAGSRDNAKPAESATSDTLKFPAPDRPVSGIVAPRWSREDVRDQYGEAAKVIALAGVTTGMTVADIGAGDGYYVARLSPIVGAAGRVIGEDITPEYVELLRARASKENLQNVQALLGAPSDPKLQARSIDVALMIHMYHEITRPYELLWNLSNAMKPAATLAILDQDGPTDRHGTPPALLVCELGVLGFEQIKSVTLDDGAYVALFNAPKSPVAPADVRKRLSGGACKQAR